MDKNALVAAGFDMNWLIELETKYGPTIIGELFALQSQGFSVAFLIEAYTKLSPMFMDIFHHIFGASANMAAAGVSGAMPVIQEGVAASPLAGPLAVMLLQQLLKILPSFKLPAWEQTLAELVINALIQKLS